MDRRFEGRRWSGAVGARACAALLACAGVALALGLVAPSTAGPAPSFARPRDYYVGSDVEFPRSVAIADLNGDRKPDLATADVGGHHLVSVLLNRGDGRFGAQRDYGTGGAAQGDPSSVAIGDLNGDRKPDLAIATDANTVSVFLNRGDGTFGAKRDYGTGTYSSSVAIGDLNGDGKPDLAAANNIFAGTVSVLLNRGDGSFQPKLDYRTGGGPSSVAIADLNGDGKPDLATANGANTVSVLLNRGDGSFQPKLDYRTGSQPNSVAIGDLNGDGKPDLATANLAGSGPAAASTVSVLLNRGDGSFAAKRDYRTGDNPDSVAIGDLNADGKPDLAAATGANNLSVLLNRGDGSFQAKRNFGAEPDPESVAIGDLNGDGKPDLVTAGGGNVENTEGILSVLLNTTGLCAVPKVRGETLAAAKRTIARAHCRIGKIRRAYSKLVKKGRVISQKPKPGSVLPSGGKVNLVVSRGRK